MSLTHALKVKRTAQCDDTIKDYVNGLLSKVENEIQSALYQKSSYVVIEVETIFDTATLDNKSAQRLVYFYTLKTLEDAGYEANIKFIGEKAESQKVFLRVKWMTSEDERLQKYMDRYIASRTLSNRAAQRPVRRRRGQRGQRGQRGRKKQTK